jgi:hypothetical protein
LASMRRCTDALCAFMRAMSACSCWQTDCTRPCARASQHHNTCRQLSLSDLLFCSFPVRLTNTDTLLS